jgi:hypothetical protein
LVLKALQFIPGGHFDRHTDIYKASFGLEASGFRLYDLMINFDDFDETTTILDVNLGPLTASA